MKTIFYTLFALFFFLFIFLILSNGDWHLKRNRHNQLPKGNLIQVREMLYVDEADIQWVLQPHNMNIFHQPDSLPAPAPPIPIPYPNVKPAIAFDPYHPNYKLLSKDGRGGSMEAILQPDGKFLIEGSKQGTYNYANPDGFSGFLMHSLLDVLPHFFRSDYDESLNR